MKMWTNFRCAFWSILWLLVMQTNAKQCQYQYLSMCQCDGNQLSLAISKCNLSITAELLQEIPANLTNIGFKFVEIENIENDAFKMLYAPNDIVFENCLIKGVQSKALEPFRTAKFSHCNFEESLELDSEHLEELCIVNSNLNKVPSLNNIRSLYFLDLSSNKISEIEKDAFVGLIELEEFYIQNNSLYEFNGIIFENQIELFTLDISDNPLQTISFPVELNLEKLVINHCSLGSIDSNLFYNLTILSELSINGNQLKDIPEGLFDRLDKLSTIDLSYNQLTLLSNDIFLKNALLEKIILNGNPLQKLPNFNIPTDPPTRNFSCSDCHLKNVDSEVFSNMYKLTSLDLSNNSLTVLDNVLENLKELTLVDLSNNKIQNIDLKAFSNNRNLGSIKLANNPLGILNSQIFRNNENLLKLDVRNTQLTTLWNDTDNELKSLKYILASGNNIQSLPIEHIKIMPKLHNIDLTKNDFVENDDSLCDSINWMSKNKVVPIQHVESAITSEDIYIDSGFEVMLTWEKVFKINCVDDESDELSNDDDIEISDDYLPDDNDELDNFQDEDDEQVDSVQEALPFVWTATSIFLIIAVLVFLITLPILFCIIKKSGRSSPSLPHFKINLNTQLGSSKKHSGLIYRPLSEEIVGRKVIQTLEFPSVHPTQHNA